MTFSKENKTINYQSVDNPVKKIIAAVIGIPVFLLVVGLTFDSLRPMPDHAVVYVSDATRTFYPGIDSLRKDGMRKMTASEARKMDYEPNPEDRDAMAFFEERGSLTRRLMERIGVLKQRQDKWNADGTWNYKDSPQ